MINKAQKLIIIIYARSDSLIKIVSEAERSASERLL